MKITRDYNVITRRRQRPKKNRLQFTSKTPQPDRIVGVELQGRKQAENKPSHVSAVIISNGLVDNKKIIIHMI